MPGPLTGEEDSRDAACLPSEAAITGDCGGDCAKSVPISGAIKTAVTPPLLVTFVVDEVIVFMALLVNAVDVEGAGVDGNVIGADSGTLPACMGALGVDGAFASNALLFGVAGVSAAGAAFAALSRAMRDACSSNSYLSSLPLRCGLDGCMFAAYSLEYGTQVCELLHNIGDHGAVKAWRCVCRTKRITAKHAVPKQLLNAQLFPPHLKAPMSCQLVHADWLEDFEVKGECSQKR